MANTRFEKDQIIEGSYQGRPYRFQILKDAEEGSGSVYGPAMDLIANRKVFLKKYIDPAPRTEWLSAFIDYHRKLQRRIGESAAAQQLVVGMDFFQDERNRFWQVIEYVDNSRDLKSYLSSSDTKWDQRVKFAKVFMFAMRTLHDELKLVHGDLKPANLLLIPQGNNFRIKLIDFDRPVFLDEREIPWASEGFLGSPGYFSPEHVKRQRPTDKSDVFTCGIILYQLLCDVSDRKGHPFSGETITPDYDGNSAPEPKFWGSFGSAELDADIARVLRSSLDPDPAKRPTAAEIHEALLRQPVSAVMRGTSDPFEIPPQLPVENQHGAADIVFLLNATGSMGSCIRALKERIHSFIHSLVTGNSETNVAPVADWRARVVGYRSFADCNASGNAEYWYRKLGGGGWLLNNPFTRDEGELHHQLDSLKAFGGGDGAHESLLDALMLVLKSGFLQRSQSDATDAATAYRWRTNGVGRVVIVFTDAGYSPEMQYSHLHTRFEERNHYPIDLSGGGLDELQNEIESGFFKLYVFAPAIKDYEELGDIPKVVIMHGGDEGGEFMKAVNDESVFNRLVDDLVKGVSRSSSDFQEMPME